MADAIRRLADSTRRAITARPSPQGAMDLLNQIRANTAGFGRARPGAAPTGPGSDPFGYVNVPGAITSATAAGRRGTLDQYGQLGSALQATPAQLSLGGAERRAVANVDEGGSFSDPYRKRTQGVTDQFGSGFRHDFEQSTLQDMLGTLENKIDAALLEREAAILAGEMEVAAQYDEEIAKLNDAKAKLVAGRANINARYGEQQSFLQGQAAKVEGQELADTGTDIAAEVAEVGEFYEQGQANIGGFLETIGADNPALAKQLGGELKEFQTLAEDRLWNDLDSQGRVLQAASLVSKKLGEMAVRQGMTDAEGARVQVESDLVGKINKLGDQLEQLKRDKAEAMAAVAEMVGDYDDAWLDDYEGVWGVVATEFLSGKGYDREQIGEMMGEFDNVWFALPTDKRNHAGMVEWINDNMAANNLGMMADAFGVGDIRELADIVDPTTQARIFTDGDLARLEAIAINGNAGNLDFLTDAANLYIQSRGGVGGLDLLTTDDYNEILELVNFRSEFRDGGYDNFVEDSRARIAGSGSLSAIDPRSLSRNDMALVKSGSGQVGYVHPSAASSLEQMVEAARRDGVQLGWSDTYRDFNLQNQAYANFLRTHENLNGDWVDNIANPMDSLHPRGLAVDFTMNAGVHEWLVNNAHRFGWTGISNEAHHWQYTGGGAFPTRAVESDESGPGETIVASGPRPQYL